MDVLVTMLYKSCDFRARGALGMVIAGKTEEALPSLLPGTACGCALDRLLWQCCAVSSVQFASRGKGSWSSDRESSWLCQGLMSLFSPLSP